MGAVAGAEPMRPRSEALWRRLVLGLFFLSGISGLLYEVAWTRMLHLLFGDTVLAVSTVLASFMAGLALGSFWSGRYVDRRPRVLALYAALEAAIGVSAVLLPVALLALTPVYVWLHQSLHASFWLFSARALRPRLLPARRPDHADGRDLARAEPLHGAEPRHARLERRHALRPQHRRRRPRLFRRRLRAARPAAACRDGVDRRRR